MVRSMTTNILNAKIRVFNAKFIRFNAKIRAFNAKFIRFNAKIRVFNAKFIRFNAKFIVLNTGETDDEDSRRGPLGQYGSTSSEDDGATAMGDEGSDGGYSSSEERAGTLPALGNVYVIHQAQQIDEADLIYELGCEQLRSLLVGVSVRKGRLNIMICTETMTIKYVITKRRFYVLTKRRFYILTKRRFYILTKRRFSDEKVRRVLSADPGISK